MFYVDNKAWLFGSPGGGVRLRNCERFCRVCLCWLSNLILLMAKPFQCRPLEAALEQQMHFSIIWVVYSCSLYLTVAWLCGKEGACFCIVAEFPVGPRERSRYPLCIFFCCWPARGHMLLDRCGVGTNNSLDQESICLHGAPGKCMSVVVGGKKMHLEFTKAFIHSESNCFKYKLILALQNSVSCFLSPLWCQASFEALHIHSSKSILQIPEICTFQKTNYKCSLFVNVVNAV